MSGFGLKKIYIEITNCCNLACPFCAGSSRTKTCMTAAAFEKVLAGIQGHTRHVALHVLGEPLLHPEFAEVLALCHAHGLRVNLVTNGTFLARHRPVLLGAPALRQISFSLHGLEPLHREATEAHLAEMVSFSLEASRLNRLFVSLRLWNLPPGAHTGGHGEWNAWLLRRLADAFAIAPFSVEALSSGRGILLAPGVYLNPEQQFAWPQPTAPDFGGRGYCRALRDHVAILADGSVIPCCLDAEGRIVLGNIFSQSLAEILDGPRARRMREGFAHQWLVEPLCRRCSYRKRFTKSGPLPPEQ